MGNGQSEDFSCYDPPTEKSAEYGDDYPVILCEQDIHPEKKENLKGLIQGNSSIKVFSFLYEALIFAERLGTSFILIVASHYDEQDVIQNSQGFRWMYARSMFDFEEEAILKDRFGGASDDLIKSLNVKAYFFTTHQDLKARLPYDENEEEVMLMQDVKDMAKVFQQESIIIWYDPQLQHEVKAVLIKKFDIEERNIYTNFAELYKRIHDSADTPYHLILTGKDEAKVVLGEITNLKNLLCLYIYCDDPEIIQRKKRSIIIEETIEKLVPRITQGIRTNSKPTNSFPAFATHFNSLDKSDIYNLHYYLKGLLNFQNRKQAKSDFLLLAKKIYESKKIFDFEQEYDEYNKKEIFKWYAMESPVYKLVNNCLRIATSDSILFCRFILKDLERAIREQYQEQSKNFNGLVYRGAYITNEEWGNLQNNIGKEIEMYGFLSTSQNIETAKKFLFSDLENKILITIIVPPLPAPELNEQGFASLSHISGFKETEILFNVRSKFRILEAGTTKINDKGKECRHLILLNGTQILRRYMTLHKPVINMKLKLPSKIKCGTCGSVQKLFGWNQRGIMVSCMSCVIKGEVPKDTPLLALDFKNIMEGERVVEKSFKGKKLELNQAISFLYYGYKCHNCQEMGKGVYYKWIDLKRERMSEQCSDCFQNGKEVEADILMIESKPYVIWQESQFEGETIDDHYQTEKSESVRYASQGKVYTEVKRFDLCLEYESKVIKKLGKKRWRELEKLESLERIGFASWKSANHKQALKYFYQGLCIRKVIYGDKNSGTAILYNNVAVMHFELGQYQEALEYYKKALEIMRAIFGDDHQQTATIFNNIASVYRNLGQYQEALDYDKKTLEIRKTIFGDKHPETADTYNNHARTLAIFGKHEEARDFLKKALEITKSIFGERHPETATTYNNIGLTYHELGQYKEALGYYKKALEIKKTMFGDKHSDTAATYNSYALTLIKLGQYEEALDFLKKALEIKKSTSGEMHPETATTYNNISLTYHELGQYEEALGSYKKALEIEKTMFGDKHSKTAAIYSNYALTLIKLGQYEEALDFLKKALEIKKSTSGEMHPETATTYNNIGLTYHELGQYEEAIGYYKKALEIKKSIFGDRQHPAIATTYHNYASILMSLGRYQEALDYRQKSLDLRKIFFGDEHPATIASLKSYESVCKRIGMIPEGIEDFSKDAGSHENVLRHRNLNPSAREKDETSTNENLTQNK